MVEQRPRRSPLENPGRLAESLHLTAPRHSFGIVFGLIVVTVIFQLSVSDTELTRLIRVTLQAVVAMAALRAAGAHVRMLRGSLIVVSVMVAISFAGLIAPSELTAIVQRVLLLTLIAMTPIAILAGVVRELREDKHVTLQTVYCGLCIYLLFGTGFAVLFAAIEDVANAPFFTTVTNGTSAEFLYYSLATLTTTGYGDFVAATEFGRAMSVTEALIGQMYLVTVLAVIVSNVRGRGGLIS